MLLTDTQTDGQTDAQSDCNKPLAGFNKNLYKSILVVKIRKRNIYHGPFADEMGTCLEVVYGVFGSTTSDLTLSGVERSSSRSILTQALLHGF